MVHPQGRLEELDGKEPVEVVLASGKDDLGTPEKMVQSQ